MADFAGANTVEINGGTNTVSEATITGESTNTVATGVITGGTTTVEGDATEISGGATTVTTATAVTGGTVTVTTATDISGTVGTVETAADISGTATTVEQAADISGTATTVTNATTVTTATTVTAAETVTAATTVTNGTTVSAATTVTNATTVENAEQVIGVEEAPEDGKTYGRKDGDWEEIVAGGAGIYSTQVPPPAPALTYAITTEHVFWNLSVDAGGTSTATLPAVSTVAAGQMFVVRQASPGVLTLVADAADTPPGVDDGAIPGSTTVALGPGVVVQVVCNGIGWVVISRYTPPV